MNDMLSAKAEVRRIVTGSKTSFLAGMRVLPKARREAMYALYAFCRLVDDIADEPGELSEKLKGLQAWREKIDALYAGQPSCAVTLALQGPIKDYDLPKAEFLAVIDGMEMDARGPIVAPSSDALALYCRRVAGAVGVLSVRIFGAPQPHGDLLAIALGEALQLTNILRDLEEDAGDGRLYLPKDLLLEAGVNDVQPSAVLANPKTAAACRALGQAALNRFKESQALIDEMPKRTIRPAILMRAVYWRLWQKLDARGFDPKGSRVRLGKLEKLGLLLRHGIF